MSEKKEVESKGVVTRLEDRSLEAYKAWMLGIKKALTGSDEPDGSMTEEDWKRGHREFWEGKER
jgi:hypothetical protein